MSSLLFVRDAAYVALGVLLIARALQDAFKIVLLPRAARSRSRALHAFYASTWHVWSRLGGLIRHHRARDNFLAVYGPLSMVMLFASWMILLLLGFGLLQWVAAPGPAGDWTGLRSALLLSADMFFTLGSVAAEMQNPFTHALAVAEAGLGFTFIALTIGYLPVLYGHFSSRESFLLRFKVRAAPGWSGHDMLRFYADDDPDVLARWLRDCEIWIAELMVSHNSYPMLAFYRSQTSDPSWITAVATILDVCAVVRATGGGPVKVQPAATYAAALNFVIDLNASLGLRGGDFAPRDRLDVDAAAGLAGAVEGRLAEGSQAGLAESIERLRAVYEPELVRLSDYLMLPLPALSGPAKAPAETSGRPRC